MSDVVAVLRIDPNLCQGHGRCYSLAPSLFEADDVGTGRVTKGSLASQDLETALQAKASCPEDAILVELSE